jgi:hemerythrin-like domain-containing protein
MATSRKPINAITLLKTDHQTVRALLAKLDKTTERASASREELLARIEQEIKVHTTIEEEIFYPAYREAVSKRDDTKLYQEAIEEHHVADIVLSELKASDVESEVFSAKAKLLKDLIEHHAEEEEKQMFPRANRAMEASELQELGQRMAERKAELQETSWLPATAGKLLAAVAGRVTRGRPRAASHAARGKATKEQSRKPAAPRARTKAKTGPAKSSSRARAKK